MIYICVVKRVRTNYEVIVKLKIMGCICIKDKKYVFQCVSVHSKDVCTDFYGLSIAGTTNY